MSNTAQKPCRTDGCRMCVPCEAPSCSASSAAADKLRLHAGVCKEFNWPPLEQAAESVNGVGMRCVRSAMTCAARPCPATHTLRSSLELFTSP